MTGFQREPDRSVAPFERLEVIGHDVVAIRVDGRESCGLEQGRIDSPVVDVGVFGAESPHFGQRQGAKSWYGILRSHEINHTERASAVVLCDPSCEQSDRSTVTMHDEVAVTVDRMPKVSRSKILRGLMRNLFVAWSQRESCNGLLK